MKELAAEWLAKWALIWGRDNAYHTPLDHVYFDLRDGEVHWVLGDEGAVPDAEIRQLEAEFITAPDGTYEEISPLTQEEHHEIFRRWLQTLPEKVRNRCDNTSISGFRSDLYRHFSEEEAGDFCSGWHDYHDQELRKLAATWLLDRGFLVDWSD